MVGENKIRFQITFTKLNYESLEQIEKEIGYTKSQILESLFEGLVDSRNAKEKLNKTIKA